MRQAKQRPPHDRIRVIAIYKTATRFECGSDWVRKVIRGDEKSDALLEYYKNAYAELMSAMKV